MNWSTHDFKGRDLELYREALNDRRQLYFGADAVLAFVAGVMFAALVILGFLNLSGGI